ncbi:MAG: 30S ribosomal protein S7 [Candidatus Eisenbacteria bacterium]|jgi:small subunit ribosomal protein S7|uniref:Small ribosomal subunit protein uS7 n=1 Tax=Eiseniibacteriota bacterium TaxID=2212470 RepID=A0A538SU85_UNCEI|nr:MAG: 30S ribosomal protein S7 [Candidatus Eisenbacteria bacterium]TMQ64273.1 MAG: 30S ribosomal protein S7 [Candidatus Eisenbacteria bacterium]
MRRASKIHKFEVQPDARFNNVLVTRFVNALMIQGKKSVAERIFYGAVDIIEKKVGSDGLSVVKSALANVKPVLEVKSRRVGGATYQVPVEVRQDRRTALALRWIIQYSRMRPDHTMAERIAAELIAASKNEGGAVKKREDTHKMAEANKAFAHYRW